jgi:DNA helicase II / ATP-dependent DNA helicase PcrA
MESLESLNPQQRSAVEATEGPLLVLAGAGSGKTRVITVRIAHLIATCGIPAHNILAVTFTNKAAGEMRERVNRLLDEFRLQSAPLITTFHSLCVRILRRDIEHLEAGYTKSFTIYDTDDSVKVIKNCLKEIGYDDKSLTPRRLLGIISAAKNAGETAEQIASGVRYTDQMRAVVAKVFRMYDQRLRTANALDFDDLLIKTVRLLGKSADVRRYYNERFRYILVDEYQDTNALQLSLIKYLTEISQNICVVGDDAQSIYGFRGADVGNILSFEDHYPSAKVIMLEQNYRSTQNILSAADSIIKNNKGRKDKTLWTANHTGEKILYAQTVDSDGEARFVADEIDGILRRDPTLRIAVLYRTNAQSRLFEEALRRIRVDYNMVGGFSFYERAEIKDMIAYLKLAMNPTDDVALMRVINTPARGLGKTSLDAIQGIALSRNSSMWDAVLQATSPGGDQSTLSSRAVGSLVKFRMTVEKLAGQIFSTAESDRPVSSIVISAIEDSGYGLMLRTENTDEAASRLENLQELVNAATEYDNDGAEGLRNFIDHAALTSDTDKFDRNASVTLMTVHAAKGLEFPVVFIVGLEDGIFPHSRSANNESELEEERRLAYVAITRAEKKLYITHAMRRRIYGEELIAEPSQFLNELPLELIEDRSQGRSWLSMATGGSGSKSSGPAAAERTAPPKRFEKTYDSPEAINEFFRGRQTQGRPQPQSPPKTESNDDKSGIRPGSSVEHPRYGRGLVLKREGSGDGAKLTVSFPGHGQKKLMEKFANLRVVS